MSVRGSPVGLQINEVLSPVFSDTKDSQHELMDRWDTVCWLPQVKTYDKLNTESDIYLHLLFQIQNIPQFDRGILNCYFNMSQKGLKETIKVWTFVPGSHRLSLLQPIISTLHVLSLCGLPVPSLAFPQLPEIPVPCSPLRSNGFCTSHLPELRRDCLSAPRPSDHAFMPVWASIHFVTNFCSTCQLDHSNEIFWLMSRNQITAKLSLIKSGVNLPTGT